MLRLSFRVVAVWCATFLIPLGCWIVASEALRLKIPSETPSTAIQARAKVAARAGLIRGDLWTAYGLSIMGDSGSFLAGLAPEKIQVGRIALETALRWSPYDSMAWLLLAKLDARDPGAAHRVPALLKMSYYTTPNDPFLITQRLLEAARTDSLSDKELRDIVAVEIGIILARQPGLRPAISSAYHSASRDGRRWLREIVEEADPVFWKELEQRENGSISAF